MSLFLHRSKIFISSVCINQLPYSLKNFLKVPMGLLLKDFENFDIFFQASVFFVDESDFLFVLLLDFGQFPLQDGDFLVPFSDPQLQISDLDLLIGVVDFRLGLGGLLGLFGVSGALSWGSHDE